MKWDLKDSRLVELQSPEREALFPARAKQWKGELTEAQYIERNRWIFAHPFGQKRISTYALISPEGQTLSSCDVLEVDMAVKQGTDLRRERAMHLASVITPLELRGRGYCARMIQAYFETHREQAGILYSDVGTEYYGRFGFHGERINVTYETAGGELEAGWDSVSLREFVEGLTEWRGYHLMTSAGDAGVVLPDGDQMDWHVERYRYFASLKGRELPKDLFWRRAGGQPEWLAIVPNFVTGYASCLWMDSGRGRQAAAAIAARWGMPGFTFWGNSSSGKVLQTELPMIRIGAAGGGVLCNPQPCDWW